MQRTILIYQFRTSGCLSVTLRKCIKTANRIEMVEIISPPDSPIILAFRQSVIAVNEIRTAITPNRASNSGAV